MAQETEEVHAIPDGAVECPCCHGEGYITMSSDGFGLAYEIRVPCCHCMSEGHVFMDSRTNKWRE